ncbi:MULTISPECIES: hypothetical protein [unclassified Mesorhizobium]|uniref:hypothetical protein n=1 Tax=unclassified Mesorhizobium TaxID=325217 RepID=UPI00112E27A7|nr:MULTISPECIES: hypothetical protein [unclassified Mesorhizobium]TPK63490.1 hypothetical protein FJ551_15685 [Mesorhizobium sp. B2-5-1]TPM18203.1 hypothetical protein FJ953_16055 [Mesorhizobium sp. B2-3-6]TPM58826.1 hypothetical protein FJ962_20325 [Mesorhizobium sp. B2-1-9]TPM79702.1 hypothetical protein FJ963_28080 [Mesorhizobium sp. B2-1-4]TPN09622.1 hypothetical protein FJ971_17490 [Mesorhizobium sp. B2-1-2]
MMTMLGATMMLAAIAASSSLSFGAEKLSVRERQVSDYAALRDRPLFSPDRTAPIAFGAPEPEPIVVQPEPEPEPPPAAAPEWQLVGIVRSERLNSATFTTPAEMAAFTLRTGESREGWTLKEVGQFEVKLDGAGGRASLRFSDEASGQQMLPPEEPVPTPSGG